MKSIMMKFVLLLGILSSLMLMWSGWTSRKKFMKSREKSSPFECGFDPKDKARMPFSLRFFMIMMLFMMFDVELSLLLQLPYEFSNKYFSKRVLFCVFMWILLLGTLEEWRRGVLNWKT